MMCEYCEPIPNRAIDTFKSLELPNSLKAVSHDLEAVVTFFDGELDINIGDLDTEMSLFDGYTPINYCPICGRKLSEVDDGK